MLLCLCSVSLCSFGYRDCRGVVIRTRGVTGGLICSRKGICFHNRFGWHGVRLTKGMVTILRPEKKISGAKGR